MITNAGPPKKFSSESGHGTNGTNGHTNGSAATGAPLAAPSMEVSGNKHPDGLYVLFFTEMWERFSYYGMRALLVLYMIKGLQFTQPQSSAIYGWYTGLVYLTPI